MDKIFSISEAAEYLGVFPLTLRNWEKLGKIKPFRTVGGHRRFRKGDLDLLVGTGGTAADKFRAVISSLETMSLSDGSHERLNAIVSKLKELAE